MIISKSDRDGYQRFYNKYASEFFPLHFTQHWKGTRDEGGHTHCLVCGETIYLGGLCFVKYLERVSVTLCNDCVNDNIDFFTDWIDWEHREE